MRNYAQLLVVALKQEIKSDTIYCMRVIITANARLSIQNKIILDSILGSFQKVVSFTK